jgi:signal transduction histidine kinase
LWENDPERAHQLLQQSLAATRSGLKEARLAIRSLRAEPLEALGLRLAIRQEAESAAARAGMQLDFAADDSLEEISPEVEQVVYRVAGEALSNAVRHSAGKNLLVKLVWKKPHLLLEVKDDGKGFDLSKLPEDGHFGLVGMRERSDLIGGHLEIFSAPGQGTRIILEVENQP